MWAEAGLVDCEWAAAELNVFECVRERERGRERKRVEGRSVARAAFCVLFLYVSVFFYLFFFCILSFFLLIFPIARLCFVTSWRSLALCESEKWLFIVKNEMWLVLTQRDYVCVCVCFECMCMKYNNSSGWCVTLERLQSEVIAITKWRPMSATWRQLWTCSIINRPVYVPVPTTYVP